MLKISKKIQFSGNENKMSSIANTEIARDLYYSAKYPNVKFLLEKRFSWMNKFIKDEDSITPFKEVTLWDSTISSDGTEPTSGKIGFARLRNIDLQSGSASSQEYDASSTWNL